MRTTTLLDDVQLDQVRGGAADPMGPTVLVGGRPQTCRAIMARGDKLFAPDNKLSNDQWLRQYKRLNDGFMRLPSLASCPPPKQD